MDIQLDVDLDIETARRFLLSRRASTIPDTEQQLTYLQLNVNLCGVVQGIEGRAYRKLIKEKGLSLKAADIDENLKVEILTLVYNKIAPVDIDEIEYHFEGSETLEYLYPEPMGMCADPQGLTDVLQDADPDNIRETRQFVPFVTMMVFNEFDDDNWKWVADIYGWKFPMPRSMVQFPDDVDWDKFKEKLTAEGLDYIYVAFESEASETGEPLLDYSPRLNMDGWSTDGGNYPLTFDEENLLFLKGEKIRLKDSIEMIRKAIRCDDHKILQRVVEIWDECCIFKETKLKHSV